MTDDNPNEREEPSEATPGQEKGDEEVVEEEVEEEALEGVAYPESGVTSLDGGIADSESDEVTNTGQEPHNKRADHTLTPHMGGLPIEEDDWLVSYEPLVQPLRNKEDNKAALRALKNQFPDRSNPDEWVKQNKNSPGAVISQERFGELIAALPDQSDNKEDHYQNLSGNESPIDVLTKAGAIDRSSNILTEGRGAPKEPISLFPQGIDAIDKIIDSLLDFTSEQLSDPQQRLLMYLGSANAHNHECDSLKARIYATMTQYADVVVPDITIRKLGPIGEDWQDKAWSKEYQYTDRLSKSWEEKYQTYGIFIEVEAKYLHIHSRSEFDDALTQKILNDLALRGLFDLYDMSVLAEADVAEIGSSATDEETTNKVSSSSSDKKPRLGWFTDVRQPRKASDRVFLEGLYRDAD